METATNGDPRAISTDTHGSDTGLGDLYSGALSSSASYDPGSGATISSSGPQMPTGYGGSIGDPTATLININGGYYDPATMTPIRSPMDPNCEMFTLDLGGNCGGGFADAGPGGDSGDDARPGRRGARPLPPPGFYEGIGETPLWQEFRPADAATQMFETEADPDVVDMLQSRVNGTRGDWLKVFWNGWDKYTGSEVSLHYWENTATGWEYGPKFTPGWSKPPWGWI